MQAAKEEEDKEKAERTRILAARRVAGTTDAEGKQLQEGVSLKKQVEINKKKEKEADQLEMIGTARAGNFVRDEWRQLAMTEGFDKMQEQKMQKDREKMLKDGEEKAQFENEAAEARTEAEAARNRQIQAAAKRQQEADAKKGKRPCLVSVKRKDGGEAPMPAALAAPAAAAADAAATPVAAAAAPEPGVALTAPAGGSALGGLAGYGSDSESGDSGEED